MMNIKTKCLALFVKLKQKLNNLVKLIAPTSSHTCIKPHVSGSLSIGEMYEDRFAPILKDGKETNCRIYLWDPEDVKRLQAIGDEIHRRNCR